MTCGECKHWRSGAARGGKEMAGHGFGVCGARQDHIDWIGFYLPMRRPACELHDPADKADVKARKEFVSKQEQRLARKINRLTRESN